MKTYTDEEFFNSPLRGVTSVLNAIFGNKFENSGIPEHILKAACERGTVCHEYIENYQKWLLNEIKEEPHLGLEFGIYETIFHEWLDERCEIIKPILIEHKLIDEKLGIKGIIDCVAEFKNKDEDESFIALVDWKTSSGLDLWTTECQLQLYYYMLLNGDDEEKALAEKITQLRCLSLTKREYKWHKFNINTKLAESLIYLWGLHFKEISEKEKEKTKTSKRTVVIS